MSIFGGKKKGVYMNYISMREEEGRMKKRTLPLICFSPQGNKYSSVISGIKVNLVDKE